MTQSKMTVDEAKRIAANMIKLSELRALDLTVSQTAALSVLLSLAEQSQQANMPSEEGLIEALAALAHEQWSGWMKYLFSHTLKTNEEVEIIPHWAVDRWKCQMNAPYSELSEKEKESDRDEARRMIKAFHSLTPVSSDKAKDKNPDPVNDIYYKNISKLPEKAEELAKRYEGIYFDVEREFFGSAHPARFVDADIETMRRFLSSLTEGGIGK